MTEHTSTFFVIDVQVMYGGARLPLGVDPGSNNVVSIVV